jgi:hypothetical protein
MITPRLPTDSAERKEIALDELFDYFCDALADVAKVIRRGQIQHQTEGWDRTKSTDHDACLLRHFIDRGTMDSDGLRHRAKIAWRALAALQIEIEAERGLPPPRGVSVPSEEDLVREDQALMNISPPGLAQPEHKVDYSKPVQLELPFTGKQLTIKDLATVAPGTKLRVVAKCAGSTLPPVGEILTLIEYSRGEAVFTKRNQFADPWGLTAPAWRFEIVD